MSSSQPNADERVADSLSSAIEELRSYLSLISERALPKRILSKVGVSDIVQQAMLKAHQHCDSFSGTTEPELRAWLRTVVENTVKDAVRRHIDAERRSVDREQSVGPDHAHYLRGTSRTPSRLLALQERDRRLLAAIEQLPERRRLVVQMRHTEQLSYEQIAERLDTTPQAARQLWSRAMEQLRSDLENDSAIG